MRRLALGASFVLVALGVGCADERIDPVATGVTASAGTGVGGAGSGGGGGAPTAGALIAVSTTSQVSVLLDEIPTAERDEVAAHFLAEPASFWDARARAQLGLTNVWRNYNVGLLPLPPPELWIVTLDAAGAQRGVVDGHDSVVMNYTFASTLLSDAASPADGAKALAEPGGVKTKSYHVPADPYLVYQRIADLCTQQGALQPFIECPGAIDARIGHANMSMKWERLAWDSVKADAVRTTSPAHADGVELVALEKGVEHNLLTYRYFEPDDCAIAEGCVGGPGWRRLLLFDASLENAGGQPLHIGNPTTSSLFDHNVFEYSPCHDHFHFRHYGDFQFGDYPGDKKAFCLISTSRYGNNESTEVVTPYELCNYQGIASGWGDDYFIGLDCQWIDVTDVDTSNGPVTQALDFHANVDQFLCEGTPVLDQAGELTYEPTSFTTEDGHPVDRPVCNFYPDWDANNDVSTPVTLPPTGSSVTEACTHFEIGPRRDCGFFEQDALRTCTPGATVTLTCSVGFPQFPAVVRACETSAVLGTGTACAELRSLDDQPVAEGTTMLSFTCPEARDASEPGGAYALYVAPLFDGHPLQTVTCTP